jgi:hypothetical protein
MTVGNLILRGMFAGLIAGLLAFGFARAFGEPQVDRAIAFEEQQAQARGEPAEPELVSRSTQAGLGLLTGIVVYGASMGGLLALVFAFVQDRFSRLDPRATSALLALAAFLAIVVIPDIKYPANPPSVGDPETIRYRTGLFFLMLAASIAAAAIAVSVARRFWRQWGAWNATIAGGAAFLVLVIIVQVLLPDINEVPEQFSAVVLWHFRVASLGIQLILWTTIGLLFGYFTEHGIAPPFGTRRVAGTYAR